MKVITAYLVLGPYDDEEGRVYGVFFDATKADQACRDCWRRYGGSLQEWRVEEREVDTIWKWPL